ncbi:uncharacterized protein LOC106173244 [Lingula anatina]|uniref:Uncharacterized protein LOC106173244 n=1 Tax=Lingula anatina TaxID=7574 RepID=A0A1S3JHB3_LINAN|nr:uncharacterized protein LOC106173244 [Lingula anatina]|eukprot:XP_013409748.1 uncharacterized protein LOC106173244 [Lingula anatina]
MTPRLTPWAISGIQIQLGFFCRVIILYVLAGFASEFVGGQEGGTLCSPTCPPELCSRQDSTAVFVCMAKRKLRPRYQPKRQDILHNNLHGRAVSQRKFMTLHDVLASALHVNQNYKTREKTTDNAKLHSDRDSDYNNALAFRTEASESSSKKHANKKRPSNVPSIAVLKHRIYRRSDTYNEESSNERPGKDGNLDEDPMARTGETQYLINNVVDHEDWTIIAIIICVVVVIFGVSFSCALICAYMQNKHNDKFIVTKERNGVDAIAEFYHESYV